jgi:phage tail-like protein
MATDIKTIKTRYPLPVYNYRVEVGGQSISFTEVSGLSIGYETKSYLESKTTEPGAGPNLMNMIMQPKNVTVLLKKGYVLASNIKFLFDWINTIKLNQIEKKDIKVRLCDEEGKPLVSWTVQNAFPVKLDAPTFDVNSNDVAIETIELLADGVTMEETS